jgi:hypothetical protein
MPTILKRLRPAQARRAFATLQGVTTGTLSDLASVAASGEIDRWYEEFDRTLFDGHTGSWRLGRALAGDDDGESEDDRIRGRAITDLQDEYLLRFRDDLENGRYLDEEGNFLEAQVRARSKMYAKALRGTANESWTENGSDDELYYWKLGATEEHCGDCPELASLSPYEKGTLFTWPGKGQTACLTNCTCHLETESGIRGFMP